MTAKKILLINPPRYEVLPEYFDDKRRQVNTTAFFPAGLLRIGAYFKENGHKVSMINCSGSIRYWVPAPMRLIGERQVGNFQDKAIYNPLYYVGMGLDEFRQKLLAQEQPDEIYVTSFFTYQWEAVHEVIKICKEVFPSAKTMLGGIYATLCPDHARTSKADEVMVGEFKATNHSRLALELLEEVPDYIILKTSRGCPSQCSYCAVHLLEGRSMRFREAEDVVDEIEEKIRDYNIRKVVMWESNILVNSKGHFEHILDLIIGRNLGLDLDFSEGFNPCFLNGPLLYKMKLAGVNDIVLSVETSDKETAVNRFRSIYKLPDFVKIMKLVKNAGISAQAFVMAGMPDQPLSDVKRTVVDVLDSGCIPRLMSFTPIPGTREYMNCYQDIAHKGLEYLHPMLWPCVKKSEDYLQLTELDNRIQIMRSRLRRAYSRNSARN